jgi:hypothetical protein
MRKSNRRLAKVGGEYVPIRELDDQDNWLAELCEYSVPACRERVVLHWMFGMYRYMRWIAGLKKNHSAALINRELRGADG